MQIAGANRFLYHRPRKKDSIYMYRLSEKGERIREMFGAIAPRYDFLNRLLSLGIDRKWRRYAVSKVLWGPGSRILDIATGTGDVALEIAAQTDGSVTISGIDFCQEMVDIARVKASHSAHGQRLEFFVAPCEAIPFPDDTFDSATIAFGIRNVVDRLQGLREICRVLKPGGRLVVLEFSTPALPTVRGLYLFYFNHILPFVGGLFSRFSAYRYLPDSVLAFPSREEFKQLMLTAGFTSPSHRDLSLGIATVYLGEKPPPNRRQAV
jgi:demethylmenaquinone methyltransferase/2-methoxy-6-polyprenyl-1,4-benzoquinol methylase